MKFLLPLLLIFATVGNADTTQATVTSLISGATGTGAGSAHCITQTHKTFQVSGTTSSGSGSGTVKIQVTNDTSRPWVDLATVTLTLGVTETSDGLASDSSWRCVRANVTAISGTGATVNANVGY